MLIRILIVDDEPFIVRCIEDLLIDQEQLDLDILTASSAQEALSWLERLKIDILITDIEMPEVSGIQLVAIAKARWPMVKALLLTAHSNFDYAYQAIQLDVESYMLKTESDAHIVEEVRRTIQKIEAEMGRARQLDVMRDTESDISAVVHRQLFLRLLSAVGKRTEDIRATLKSLGFVKDERLVLLVLARIYPDQEDAAHLDALLRHFVSERIGHSVCQQYDGIVYWLMQPSREAEEKGHKFELWLKGTLEIVQAVFGKTKGHEVSFVTALVEGTSTAIPVLAKNGARRLREGAGGFIYSVPGAWEEEGTAEQGGGMVRVIKEYIRYHLNGDLSLHQFSEMTHYNPAYISRFFHEKCGETLNQYIARMRITDIKRRMEDETLSLGEIAEQAGFESRPYFNRFVKRVSGMTPQALRDSVKNEKR